MGVAARPAAGSEYGPGGGSLRVAAICLGAAAVAACAALEAAEPCETCHEGVALGGSVHEPLGCEGCHSGVSEIPHAAPVPKVDCTACHAEQGEKFAASMHGHARLEAGPFTCSTCHGNHDIPPVQGDGSAVRRSHVAAMCGRCHGDLKFVVEQPGLFSTRPFFAYQESVHGRAVEQGRSEAAICTDCHTAHEVTRPDDPRSPIFRSNIPGTCGRCHAAVYAEYRESIHGQAAAGGLGGAPVCTSCHGIHSIRSPIDPESRVSVRAVARSTCAQCHQSEQLTDDFGLPRQRVESYYDSFHGLESRLGSVTTANCASCHGVHNIFPSSDPRSTIHASNLAATCGRCHPGASENFARGQIHLVSGVSGPRDGAPPAPDPFGTRVVRLVRDLYISLIVVVIGGMALHNLIDFVARARRRLTGIAATHVRLTLAERLQHAALIVSFMTLVVTGFALKFPGSAWVRALFLGSPEVRSTLHRVAGVLLILLALWHALWLWVSRRGREQLRELRPGLHDALDMVGAVRHNLGLTPHPPACGRFTYAEKAEYWALVWGTGLMAVTGVILWAEQTALRWIPKWGFDVVEVIHYYEAWLATLAIVVWHLYFTLLRPGNHTLRWAWLTGRLADEEWREEHPAEHARSRGSAPPVSNQGGDA